MRIVVDRVYSFGATCGFQRVHGDTNLVRGLIAVFY